MDAKSFTKYETARILGARALQIAMNAPLLIKISQEDLEKIKFDALKIAEIELNSNILPISVKQPLPAREEGELKRSKEIRLSDEKKAQLEGDIEKQIAEGGEIMGLVNSPEEAEDTGEKAAPEETQ